MTLDRRCRKMLIWLILAPICLVVGIPLIVFSAINGWWIAMAVAICMVMFGFYGTPLIAVAYGNSRTMRTVWLLITQDHILSVADISSMLGRKTRDIQKLIHTLINKRYLVGYRFVGQQQLVPKATATAPSTRGGTAINKCDNCGAMLVADGDYYRCNYCGSIFSRNNK